MYYFYISKSRDFCKLLIFFIFKLPLNGSGSLNINSEKLAKRVHSEIAKISQSFDDFDRDLVTEHTGKHAASARVIRCTFSTLSGGRLYSVGLASRWAMLDGMRNTSEAVRHSYLNQHNSGDEWLTGFEGEGKGEGEGEEERVDGGNALHLWKLLRPNFSVKCMIYGRAYYLRSCPSTIQCTSHRIQHFSLSLSRCCSPPEKITLHSVDGERKIHSRVSIRWHRCRD